MRMKRSILVMLVLGAGASIVYSQSWSPSDAEIAKLESGVQLEQLPRWNSGHLPALSGYTRYYTGSTVEGERVIFGELVIPLSSQQHPGVHIVGSKKDFPMIFDGGCSVVNLVYSVKEQKIKSIGCNGYA
jgi:hypothetical protein